VPQQHNRCPIISGRHEVFVKERSAPRVDHVTFGLSVGTAVPRSVRIVAVPQTIIEIQPTWRGYEYFMVGDRSVAQSLNNLAELYRRLGRSADAEPLYKRSLAIREKVLGPIIVTLRNRWIPWLSFTVDRAVTPTRSRSTNGCWQTTRRRSVPTIPTSRHR